MIKLNSIKRAFLLFCVLSGCLAASIGSDQALCDLRVHEAHQFLNQKIKYATDMQTYQQEDYWALASELLAHKQGDCEDFALFAFEVALAYGCADRLELIHLVPPKAYWNKKPAHMNWRFLPLGSTEWEYFDDKAFAKPIDEKTYLQHFSSVGLKPYLYENFNGYRLATDEPNNWKPLGGPFSTWRQRYIDEGAIGQHPNFEWLSRMGEISHL